MNKKTSPLKGPVITRLGDILQDSDGLLTLVKLNFLFIITAVPVLPFITVFTAGGSLCALLHCTNILVKNGSLQNIKNTYFNEFRKNLRRSMSLGAAAVVLSCILVFDVFYYLINSQENVLYIPVASASLLALILLTAVAVHIFSDKTHYDKPYRDRLKNAVSLLFSRMGKTIAAVVFSLVFMLCFILFIPASIPLFFTIGFSVPALAAAFAHSDPEW